MMQHDRQCLPEAMLTTKSIWYIIAYEHHRVKLLLDAAYMLETVQDVHGVKQCKQHFLDCKHYNVGVKQLTS